MKTIDGLKFSEMILHGANNLSQNAAYVDSLNVFPVPDGDTGTNMNLSMTSGAKEVNVHAQKNIGKVGSAFAKGLLMGARGNSGVILSQLFRGFSKHIEAKSEINASEFAAAFEAGVVMAYKAVMKPVEGTILTVAKDAAKVAIQVAKSEVDVIVVMSAVVEEAKASLQRTPDLLPVLKEVGVVDSGGQGLLFVYEGFLSELKGEKFTGEKKSFQQEASFSNEHDHIQSFMNTEDIIFGYCTEFMVKLEQGKRPFNEQNFRNELSEYGDSLLVISDEEVVKVHIHSESPGTCFNYGQQYGSLIKMKVENMREQHSAIVHEAASFAKEVPENTKKKEFGVVSISMGTGISKLFKSLGADVIVEGGQTMNPSTEDILKAVDEINAETVFIFPNNKNIILAAEQAKEVSDRNLVVIPTKTIPQGMISLFSFNPVASASENETTMVEAIGNIRTGQVTFAVRDTTIDGVDIKKDDFMGLIEGKIKFTNKDRFEVASRLLTETLDGADILTIIYGEDVSAEELQKLEAFVSKKFPDVELEIHEGNQPLYPYIFGVE